MHQMYNSKHSSHIKSIFLLSLNPRINEMTLQKILGKEICDVFRLIQRIKNTYMFYIQTTWNVDEIIKLLTINKLNINTDFLLT